MHDPTNDKFLKVQALHRSGAMIGKDRPVGRVTWSKGNVFATTSGRPGIETVRYLDKKAPETELLSVQSIKWQRSIGTDAATCTINLLNVRPDFAAPEGIDTGAWPGYLTPGRGENVPNTYSVFSDGADPITGEGQVFPTTWGYSSNQYRDVLIPNTVLRCYEGYGSDNFDSSGNERDINDIDYVAPKDDTQLYMTGMWLIDKVQFGADGTIVISCRDLAKLLIEQYIYPPMIPISRFPLSYCPSTPDSGQPEYIGPDTLQFHSSSVDQLYGYNVPIYGHYGSQAFDNDDTSFWLSCPNNVANNLEWVQATCSSPINEIILNCRGGNYIAYICIHEPGGWLGDQTISGTSGSHLIPNVENLTPVEGNGSAGYVMHTVVHGDTLWDIAGTFYGNHLLWPIIAKANSNIIKDPHWIYPGQHLKIPYVPGTRLPPPPPPPPVPHIPQITGGTHVEIPYVTQVIVGADGLATISLDTTYDADFIRVVFSSLQPLAGDGQYYAGVNTLIARRHTMSNYLPSTVGKAGYIQDWSTVPKELCAWAGFSYVDESLDALVDPDIGSTNGDEWLSSHLVVSGNQILNTSTDSKPIKVWGDFESLGAGPVVCTPADYFISKSFMEGIRLIADAMGAIFFVDEGGGAQFRLPNIWSTGNFIDDPTADATLAARILDHPIEYHEDANILSYQMTLDDSNLRSEILVIGGYPDVTSNFQPVAGGYVLGYNPVTQTTSAIDFSNILAGQYRLMVVPGDNTKLFYNEDECQRMAELTALFILFTYRQGTIHGLAHPGLQIDDQIRIYDRVTSEANVHYVSGISSSNDLTTGLWTYDITTHWLGADPDTNWFIDKAQLTPAVLSLPSVLQRIGNLAGSGAALETLPFGT